MSEIVLVGDSIFDNVKYVKPADGEKPVIEHLRSSIPTGWTATLLAVDGNITTDIATQMTKLPSSATHLAMSVGGNDAIQASGILQQSTTTVDAALTSFSVLLEDFRDRYRKAMAALLSASRRSSSCARFSTARWAVGLRVQVFSRIDVPRRGTGLLRYCGTFLVNKYVVKSK